MPSNTDEYPYHRRERDPDVTPRRYCREEAAPERKDGECLILTFPHTRIKRFPVTSHRRYRVKFDD
jgi:hypothetical protein